MADISDGTPAPSAENTSIPFTIGLLQWPTSTSQYQDPSKPWRNMDAPIDLRLLPDRDEIPQELLDILDWSMLLPSDMGEWHSPSSLSHMLSPLQKLLNNEGYVSKLPATISADVSQLSPPTTEEIEIDTASEYFKAPESNFETSCIPNVSSSGRSRSRSRDQPLTKLRQLKSSLMATPSDLYSEIKESIDHKRAGRAEREFKQKAKVECIGCFDEHLVTDSTILPCTHGYCKTCIRSLIKSAMQTESNYPPKCCLTEIPLKTVLLSLDASQRQLYKLKAAEYAVPTESRWYCPRPQCAKFILPSKISTNRAFPKCPYCDTKICKTCRGDAHNAGTDCPQDYGLEAALQSAENEGWQRCYRCRTMVELTTGCRHITCKCGAEFCYVCGMIWKTCACTETDLSNRRAFLGQRRTERDAAANAEEFDIARAIAEVETFERRQVQEMALERHRLDAERREEEQQLARLEELRLNDEARRMYEEEEAERQRVEVLRLSITERGVFLQEILQSIVLFQQSALISRHEREERALDESLEGEIANQRKHTENLMIILQKNTEKRRSRLEKQHSEALSALSSDHESREDAIFLHLQNYLRGKSNREAREERMLGEFKAQLEEEVNKLTEKQEFEMHKYETESAVDKSGLEHADQSKQWLIKDEHDQKFISHRRQADDVKEYFEFINKRRTALLREHVRIMLDELEHGIDPVGLTRDMAFNVMPPFPFYEDVSLAVEFRGYTSVVKTATTLSLRNSGCNNSDWVQMPSTPTSAPKMIHSSTTASASKIFDDDEIEVAATFSRSETSFESATSTSLLPALTDGANPEAQTTQVHRLRTTMRTASISTSTTTTETANIDEKEKGRRWSLFGGKGKGKEKERKRLTNEQIRELLRGTIGNGLLGYVEGTN